MNVVVTMKTGKTHMINNIAGFENFHQLTNHILKAPWNTWDKLMIQTSQIESIEKIE